MSIMDSIKLFGPAWIALLANADAASILGGVLTGEQYGTKLLWFIVMLSFPLYVIQEASGRLGAVTGKGLGEVIRTEYTRKVALMATIPMFLVDSFTYLSEYVGIAVGASMLGINPVIILPLVFALHLLIIVSGELELTERVLLVVTAIILSVSLFLVFPLRPLSYPFYVSYSPKFILFLALNVGAVVTPPCMLVYQSTSTAFRYSKYTTSLSYKLKWNSRETLMGSLATELVIALAVIIGHKTPYEVISSINSFLGILLISSGFLALVVVSLASSWGVLESLGMNTRSNVKKVYFLESIPMFVTVLLLGDYLKLLNLAVTILSISPIVIVLPSILIGILVSKKRIMGKYTYSKTRTITYFVVITLFLITGLLGLIELS
ncbi:divalent metal cation transporter [Sulfuracidifex tepidarius]|nr:divalent metal cation transporter [Sulfuracidifex tepidarius]